MNSAREAPRSTRAMAWFLAVAYGIGAPVSAFLELDGAVLSTRFGIPPALLYLACLVQVVGAASLFLPRHRAWGALALTATTLGAMGAHLRIGSPLTAVPALLFTVGQLWFAWATYRSAR